MTEIGKVAAPIHAPGLEPNRRRISDHRTAVWLGNFGSVALRFALSVLVARLAGADQMGIYVAVVALTVIIERITDFGLPNALVYFVRAHPASTRRCLIVCLVQGVFVLPVSIFLLLSAQAVGLVNADLS